MAKKPKNNNVNLKKTSLLIVVLVIIVLLIMQFTGHLFHKTSTAIIPSTNTENKSNSFNKSSVPTSSPSSNPTNNLSQKNPTPTNTNTKPPLSPSGTFVSNHNPGLNGTPTSEQSSCSTTPGATCYIKFIKDGVVKTLTTQTTNNSGATFWAWDIKDASTIGLTSGSWQVSAVATLNGISVSANDVTPLVIQ